MKRTLAFILVIISLLTLLASCGSDELVGTWSGINDGADVQLVLEEDGTCGLVYLRRTYLGKWEKKDGKLSVKVDDAGTPFTFIDSAEYSISEGKLTITEPDRVLVLTKENSK